MGQSCCGLGSRGGYVEIVQASPAVSPRDRCHQVGKASKHERDKCKKVATDLAQAVCSYAQDPRTRYVRDADTGCAATSYPGMRKHYYGGQTFSSLVNADYLSVDEQRALFVEALAAALPDEYLFQVADAGYGWDKADIELWVAPQGQGRHPEHPNKARAITRTPRSQKT